MSKRFGWQTSFALALIVLSVIIYLVHYAIFRDPHHIFIFMVGHLAFIPIEVLLVTLVIHRLLRQREKRSIFEKMNMLIGAFFGEVGTTLLAYFSDLDPKVNEVRADLIVNGSWPDERFGKVSKRLQGYEYRVDVGKAALEDMRRYLKGKREFLVRLLENPSLLEQESFTELLWAVFHLAEELEKREKLTDLPDTDLEHLASDISRAYALLVHEWLRYMHYLRYSYPYLFSLAMRTNPFDQNASVLVE